MVTRDFKYDQVYDTGVGLKLYKSRELDKNKTTFRVIELESTKDFNPNHPLITALYNQYEGSISKAYWDKEDWVESLKDSDTKVVLIPDLKGDKFFEDRWERVLRFVEKQVPKLVAK